MTTPQPATDIDLHAFSTGYKFAPRGKVITDNPFVSSKSRVSFTKGFLRAEEEKQKLKEVSR